MALQFVLLTPLIVAGAVVALVLRGSYGRRATLACFGCLLLFAGLLTWFLHVAVLLPQYSSASTTEAGTAVAWTLRILFDVAGATMLVVAALSSSGPPQAPTGAAAPPRQPLH